MLKTPLDTVVSASASAAEAGVEAAGAVGNAYFTCFPVGLWWQPTPADFDPHQMHLQSPGPWRCLLVGEWWHPAP